MLHLLFKLWFGVSQWVVRGAICSHATAVDSKSRGVANAKILIQSVEDLASAKLTPTGTCHVFGWGEKVVAGKVISRAPTMPADLILHPTSIPHAIPAQDLGIRCVNVSPTVNVKSCAEPPHRCQRRNANCNWLRRPRRCFSRARCTCWSQALTIKSPFFVWRNLKFKLAPLKKTNKKSLSFRDMGKKPDPNKVQPVKPPRFLCSFWCEIAQGQRRKTSQNDGIMPPFRWSSKG